MTDYCTDAEVQGVLPEYRGGTAATVMAAIITRASRRVDAYLGPPPYGSEWFPEAGVAPSARTFYGTGTPYLFIGGFTETEVTADDLAVPSAYTKPTFAARGGYLVTTDSSGVLYSESYSPWFGTARWLENVPVTVTLTWGYATTPADITEATLLLVVASWRQRVADTETGGDVGKSFAMPPEAARILDQRRCQIALAGVA